MLPVLPYAPPSSVPSSVCTIPVVDGDTVVVEFTAVISPAPAATKASFTAFVVGIELGSSAIEADTLRNAAVPIVLFFNNPLTSNNTSKSVEPPAATLESVNVLNVGESACCNPVSTSVFTPFIVALTVPCDGEENVEPLTTVSSSNFVFTFE